MAGCARERPPMWSRKRRQTTLEPYCSNHFKSRYLAERGFHMEDGSLRCAYCTHDMPLDDIRAGMDPLRAHALEYPRCVFLMIMMGTFKINAETGATTPDTEVTPWGLKGPMCRENGELRHPTRLFKRKGQAFQPPQYETMAEPEARRESFRYLLECERRNIPDVENLVSAGFMLDTDTGNGVVTRCYHCNVGINMWRPHTDPMVEHARHSPDCWHVILSMGEQFVNSVALHTREVAQVEADISDQFSSNTGHSDQRSEAELTPSESPSRPENIQSTTACNKRPYTDVEEHLSKVYLAPKSDPKRQKTATSRSDNPKGGGTTKEHVDLRLQRKRKLGIEPATSEQRAEKGVHSLMTQLGNCTLEPREVQALERHRGYLRYSRDECYICQTREDVLVHVCCKKPICRRSDCQKRGACQKCNRK